MDIVVPSYLHRDFGRRDPRWVASLPEVVEDLAHRWDVLLGEPLGDPPAAAGWVAPGVTSDGRKVFLKVGWPHPEAETEAAGLRFYDGHGAVRMLVSDGEHFALLTEAVTPGQPLTELSVDAGNEAAAEVLKRLWRPPDRFAESIGPLTETVAGWNASYAETRRQYPSRLVINAADLGVELARTQADTVVVHGDYNPTNILRSDRHGWTTIDPKPLVGDPAYDLAQFLANRVDAAIAGGPPTKELTRQVHFFADVLDLDPVRIAGWAAVKAVGWNWGPDTAELFDRVLSAVRV